MRDKHYLVITKVVAGMFADFCNASNRGDKFTWNNFPNIVASHVSSTFFVYFTKKQNVCVGDVEKEAKDYAENLCRRAGYIE